MARTLTPYEQNLLRRCGADPMAIQDVIEEYGEMPVEYITGQAEFGEHLFSVTPDTLIPRVETEEMLDLALDSLAKELGQSNPKTLTLIDVGTGCGALGITLTLKAQAKWPEAKISTWLTDVSEPAVAVAAENAELLLAQLPNMTIQTAVSDLLQAVPADIVFDVVVANLPYIPSERIPYLDESVKDFEPHLALDGGEQGLDLVNRLLHDVVSYLKPSSQIWLETDHTHTIQAVKSSGDFQFQQFFDQFHQPRFMRLVPTITTAVA